MRVLMILFGVVLLACYDGGQGGTSEDTRGDTPAESPTVSSVLMDADGDGYIVGAGDCDDTDPDIHPNAEELCDGIDQDCDGEIDNNPRFDADGDGYPNPLLCDTSEADCDDGNSSLNPGAEERCDDDVDNDCDGEFNEGCP